VLLNNDSQRKKLIKWKKSLYEKIREKDLLDLKAFTEKNKIDDKRSNLEIIKIRMYSILKKIKWIKTYFLGDIRRYLLSREQSYKLELFLFLKEE